MLLDVRKLLSPTAESVRGSGEVDFSACDFEGFTVPQPAMVEWLATPQNGAGQLWLQVKTVLHAECARCLAPAQRELLVEKTYRLAQSDLDDEYPELPIGPNGMLDLDEMAYGEVVIEAPAAILCRDDCPGLCPQCGAAAGECDCAQQREVDPRLAPLLALLDNGDDE